MWSVRFQDLGSLPVKFRGDELAAGRVSFEDGAKKTGRMDRSLINPDSAPWEKAKSSSGSEKHFKQGSFKSS